MRLFKTLMQSMIRDFRKNMKQFIAIVFIIGIAVVLFTGLSSNSIEFERRVDEVFSPANGNIADIWVTIDPEITTLGGTDSDLLSMEIFADTSNGGKVETRLLAPAVVGNSNSYALISYDRPTVNKEYATVYDYGDENINKDFFFVDEGLLAKYRLFSNRNFSLGDKLPITFDTSIVGGLKSSVENMPTTDIADLVKEIIKNSGMFNPSVESSLEAYIDAHKDDIRDTILGIFDTYMTGKNVDIDLKINGVMKHPENIQTSKFNSSYFMLGTTALVNGFVDKVASDITYEKLVEYINDNVENAALKAALLGALSGYSGSIDAIVNLASNSLKYDIIEDENNRVADMSRKMYNQFIIQVADKTKIDSTIDKINTYYSGNSKLLAIMDKDTYPSNAVIENDIVQSRQLTYCFPIIFFVVAVLVVLTTITQMMLKQRTQIGTMKALGISKGKILLYYLSYMNVIGLVGILLGLLIGPLLLPAVMNIKYTMLYELPALGYSFPWLAGLAMALGVIVLITLLTYILIRKEISYVPAKSMRPAAPNLKLKAKKTKMKNISLMMALRNIKVHLAKSFMVIIGVMGCTGLLICGLGIDDAIVGGKDVDLYQFYGSDFNITYNNGQAADVIDGDILAIDGIDTCEEYATIQGSASTSERAATVPIYYFSKTATNFKYDDEFVDSSGTKGQWDLDGIGISEVKAEDLDVKEGDSLDIVYSGNRYTFKISKVFYTFSTNGVFIYRETFNSLHASNPSMFKSSDITNTRTGAWSSAKKKDGKPLVFLSTLKNKIKAIDGVAGVATFDENNERIDSYMTSVRSMTNTIKIFAICLAVVVLINLAILNFQERSRDIATLRVLGFSRFEISRSLVYEVMILTVVGAGLGLLIGLPLEMLVLGINKTPLISWFYTVSPLSYSLAFILSVITAFLVNIFISYRINKIHMAESLKSVE